MPSVHTALPSTSTQRSLFFGNVGALGSFIASLAERLPCRWMRTLPGRKHWEHNVATEIAPPIERPIRPRCRWRSRRDRTLVRSGGARPLFAGSTREFPTSEAYASTAHAPRQDCHRRELPAQAVRNRHVHNRLVRRDSRRIRCDGTAGVAGQRYARGLQVPCSDTV